MTSKKRELDEEYDPTALTPFVPSGDDKFFDEPKRSASSSSAMPEWMKALQRQAPPTFDPADKKGMQASEFIEKLSIYIKLRNISDEDAILYLIPSVLKGDSFKWYHSTSNTLNSVPDFIYAFKRNYRQFYDKDSQRANLYFLFQDNTENFETYCWRVYKAFEQVDSFVNKIEVCQRIINSSRKEYELILRSREFTSLESLIEAGKSVELRVSRDDFFKKAIKSRYISSNVTEHDIDRIFNDQRSINYTVNNVKHYNRNTKTRKASNSKPLSKQLVDTRALVQTEDGNYKLTQEERERRYNDSLCLYCSDPKHKLRECPKLGKQRSVQSDANKSESGNAKKGE